MKRSADLFAPALLAAALLVPAVLPGPAAAGEGPRLANPAIDMNGFLVAAQAAARHRESRRVTEEEFLRMSREPGTVVLDARSREKYDLLHVAGAVNLAFPDITVESLRRLLPDTGTRVLIYCNNNFLGDLGAFPTKMAPASLNLSTYVTLYTYGYRNVYELGPLIDVKRTILPFASAAGR